jgi:C-lobe and N-lobe beta barrels of Tf-binding protein B
MRPVPLFFLLLSSVSLAACAGGGGALTASGTLSDTTEVCGVNDTGAGCSPSSWVDPSTPPTTPPVVTPPPPPGGTGTGGTNTGNDQRLATGDVTIIKEAAKLKSSKAKPGLSKLTIDSVAGTAKIQIDTKQPDAQNKLWPAAKELEEFTYGTKYDDATIATRNLGGTYKEYRALSYNDDDSSADEVLQVWNWGHSYGTQYRDLTSGGEAGHQAWSFGGTKTALDKMPTTGSINYNGRFGSTAKTWSWEDPSNGRIVSANNIWRVTGAATGTADFATGNFQATLTPEAWNAYASLNGGKGFTFVSAGGSDDAANEAADVNYNDFMNDKIILKGKISAGGATTGAIGNTIAGTATMQTVETATGTDNGWVTNKTSNPFYGAFFGDNADEVTGVFNLEAVAPDPVGGDIPINDDRRGFIQHTGVFNVQ